MAWRTLRTLTRARFDVLHALWAHEPGYLATMAGRRTGTPTVVSVLGGELVDLPAIGYGGARTRLNRHLIRRALATADRVTVPTDDLRSAVEPLADPTCIGVAPLGVDTDRFRPGLPTGDGPRLDGAPALLQVGSLVPVKDHRTLIDAFAVLRADIPRACLHVVGDGPLRPTLEARAARHGLADAVRFHGAVDHGALPDLYRQADLVTLSSRFESQGMVLLEAAACGRTVAGSAVGALPSLVPDRHAAPPGDAAALAAAFRQALDDHLGTSEAEAEARARDVAARYGLAVAAGRFSALYESLEHGTIAPP